MADIKIFKSDIIGSPSGDIVLDNEIQGVFGEVLDTSQVPRDDGTAWGDPNGQPNIVTSQSTQQEYDLNYRVEEFVDTAANRRASARYLSTVKGFEVTFDYDSPIKNIVVEAFLNVKMYSYLFLNMYASRPEFGTVGNFIRDNRDEYSVVRRMGEIILKPDVSYTISDHAFALDVSDSVIEKFRVVVKIKTNSSSSGSISDSVYYADSELGRIWWHSAGVTMYEPQSITLTIRADTLRSTPQIYQVGEQTKALRIDSNPLVTTKATINGIPLYQHNANKIINDWHDGKQTAQLTKVINNNAALGKTVDIAVALNARESGFVDTQENINASSYEQNADGTAKKYIVTSAEYVYDGSHRQILDMQEVKKED